MPWDCGMQLRLVLVRDEWTWRCSAVRISCLTALCFWNLAVCTLVRILLTIQRQESWLKEWKTTYTTSRNAERSSCVKIPSAFSICFAISRLRRRSQFASRFHDSFSAFSLLRNFDRACLVTVKTQLVPSVTVDGLATVVSIARVSIVDKVFLAYSLFFSKPTLTVRIFPDFKIENRPRIPDKHRITGPLIKGEARSCER